jgi:hypothetical protein
MTQRRFDEKVDLEVPPYRRPRVAQQVIFASSELPETLCATGLMQWMAQQLAQMNLVDAKALQNTPPQLSSTTATSRS